LKTIVRLFLAFVLAWTAPAIPVPAESPIVYGIDAPAPSHHWMQVEASFTELGSGPLELRMSRASPGRYAIHNFAKNVYDVRAFAPNGRELYVTRSDPSGWMVDDHGDAVTVKYKIFGDQIDGTYLAIDATHIHLNMPAAIMWGRGLDDRPVVLRLTPPEGVAGGRAWQVATQLHPGSTEFEFTAPNLQYLMDSPVEFGPLAVRSFGVGGRRFRLAVHHTGTDADVDVLLKDVERIVREEGAIYGEYPTYEPGAYTFLADYLPYANDDGMEHRNSTVMTASATIKANRAQLLETVAHEFFHCWNVERIRPRDLEPFDFDRENMSGELWLAEGFTQYYGPLALKRAGLTDLSDTLGTLTGLVDAVVNGEGMLVRSAVEMSQMAPFVDGARSNDRGNLQKTYVSYYTLGGAIALALDLTLRDRSDGRITLDDYMRAMWRTHGRPGGVREGYVGRPYTLADAEARLAEVGGDAAFARDFFDRYIKGRDVADYKALLLRAGLVVRQVRQGRASWGDIGIESDNRGARIAALVPTGSPAYLAGLEQDDVLRRMAGEPIYSADDVAAVLGRHHPGDRVQVNYVDRSGNSKTAGVTLIEDPHVEIVPIETTEQSLTPSQQAFRNAWLGAERRSSR
jgi:predicted metalloprotease with PDZ domain